MDFLVISLFVLVVSSPALIATYFLTKRRKRKLITFIPSIILLVISVILSLASRLEFEPGSWADLVFILYALIVFYAFIVNILATLALNFYFKNKQ